MNAHKTASAVAAIVCYCLHSLSASAAEPIPDERDRLVLKAVLTHLRADTNFNLTRTTINDPTIVLHAQTPEKAGFLGAAQMRSDLGDQNLPSDAENDLRSRNTKTDAKPDSYAAVAASYTNLNFNSGIVVADLTGVLTNRLSFRAFDEVYPAACGYVRAYLPGYSADGTQAIVRATVGPTPHGATITALLQKVGEKWTVQWYRLARYV